ncbi:MAG: DNRLRE domain-containing protein [Candidatus Omnitrophota bacterium]
MKKRLTLSVLFCLILVSQAMAIPLSATDDASVFSKQLTSNYGSHSLLYLGYTSTVGYQYSYLKFDLSDYSDISSAKLWLYDSSSGSPFAYPVYSAANNWDEGTVTYNNRPGYSGSSVVTTVGGVGWYSWDVTSFADTAVGGPLSLALISPYGVNSTNHNTFYSDEYTIASFRPYLDVTGTAPVPEPSSLLLLGTGLVGFVSRRLFKKTV